MVYPIVTNFIKHISTGFNRCTYIINGGFGLFWSLSNKNGLQICTICGCNQLPSKILQNYSRFVSQIPVWKAYNN